MSDWVPDEEVSRLIRKFALQNALEYDGKGQAGSVQGRVLGENTELREQAQFLYAIIAPVVEEANKIWAEKGADEVRRILEEEAPEALEKRTKERREGLPELPNAVVGKVVLRFAPNPNGPLSLGHARGVVINAELAKMYDGEVILRFDDTDAVVKRPDPEAYALIEEDFLWLAGKAPDRILKASDRMDVYLEYSAKALEDDFAYVCECTGDEFKQFREDKTECPCRNRPTKENISLWKQMNDGSIQPGGAVVRIKTDMTLPNPALRDWPALRIQHADHPLVGDRYKVWPLLDFQSAVEDHLQGVTHIVRGNDLMDSTRKQTLLYEKFGWTYPETMYWGRVKVHEFGGFSTSQMKKDIESGQYTGWDDPRLPTLRALRRRGYDAGAMRKFWIDLGLTQKDISVPMSTLNSLNAKAVDADAPRLSFVEDPRTVILDISGIELTKVTLPIHPEHPDKGVREWPLGDSPLKVKIASEDFTSREARRLKDFADIGIKHKKTVKGWVGEIARTERVGNTPIIHWLPNNMAQPAVLLLEEDGELIAAKGLLEINDYPDGTVVQLERMGFAILEGTEEDGSRRLVRLHG
ncbi:MAG: glutamate--tRNA ligase [Candidatus Thalassarchaeaceae archaeon]|jgi:glutamyl-tRNA synthetase|nr:glutamate--tRNA ligase [Candidatus Thalassarchaeaceae archaeon]MDP7042882.1 glutamate--tRNA ligase [Candidatus Thalassarchaeaceae archaeon]